MALPDQVEEAEKRVFAKIRRRLLPILVLSYIIAYVDRINVGFAKSSLASAIGVGPRDFETAYGLGAGLFFLGYFLCEVPSNLILQKVGARIWIARIMAFWGLASIAMLLVKSTAAFYVLRFVLGAAEAGFFPGVVVYLSDWFPASQRAHNIAVFSTGSMIAGIVGSGVSGLILHFDGWFGLQGWQWLFLVEGVPALLMSVVLLRFLPDHWLEARWLTEAEKTAIAARFARDERESAYQPVSRLRDVFASRSIWFLCGLYFLLNVSGYGYELWSPTIIRALSPHGDLGIGLINAIPYLASGFAMVIVARRSDRTGRRGRYVAWSALASALGFFLAARLGQPLLALGALTVGLAGLKSILGPFWALVSSNLKGTGAAAGIALVNSVGNLGGFAGPVLVGLISNAMGSSKFGLLAISGGVLLLSGLAFWRLPVLANEPI